MRIDRPEDVEPALREAFALKERLVFLDVITDQSENVYPMVPGGKGLNQMDLPAHMRAIHEDLVENNRDYGNLC